MALTSTIEKIKLSLRTSHNKLDDDISADIDACLADLETIGGIKYPQENDPLIFKAIKLYCKSSYTDDTAKSEKYFAMYEKLRACLSVAEGYGYIEEDGEND